MIKFVRTEQHPHISLEDAVGFLPHSWDASDPRPAIVQHDSRPNPGGPWHTGMLPKWKWNPDDHGLKYPGDPTMFPLAYAELPLSSEMIFVYPGAWVAIIETGASPKLIAIDRRD